MSGLSLAASLAVPAPFQPPRQPQGSVYTRSGSTPTPKRTRPGTREVGGGGEGRGREAPTQSCDGSFAKGTGFKSRLFEVNDESRLIIGTWLNAAFCFVILKICIY